MSKKFNFHKIGHKKPDYTNTTSSNGAYNITSDIYTGSVDKKHEHFTRIFIDYDSSNNSLDFYLDPSKNNSITDKINNGRFLLKKKRYVFEKANGEDNINHIYITDVSQTDIGQNMSSDNITFGGNVLNDSYGLLNGKDKQNPPDSIKIYIPHDKSPDDRIFFRIFENNNVTTDENLINQLRYFDFPIFPPPSSNPPPNYDKEKGDKDIVRILPINVDFNSEIKPLDDNDLEIEKEKTKWQYKLEGESQWREYNLEDDTTNKFDTEDFTTIKNLHNNKRIQKIRITDKETDSTDINNSFVDINIKKDLTRHTINLNENIRTVDEDNSIEKKMFDIKNELKKKNSSLYFV